MNSKYDYLTVNGELSHHGILGQRWGVRRFQNKDGSLTTAGKKRYLDGTRPRNTKSEYLKEKFHLSDNQKKAIKIGAAVAATALVAYGGYKLGSNPQVQDAIKRGMSALSGKSNSMSADQLKEMGIEVTDIDRVDVDRINFDVKGDVVNINNGRSNNSGNSIKFNARDINPTGGGNNCKHVAEATIKRALGIDPNATAVGDDSHVAGNLHDFVNKQGYNPSGVTFLGGDQGYIAPDPSGDSKGRVTRQILKKFNDGDVGMISFRYDPHKVFGDEFDIDSIDSSDIPAHAFNFFVKSDQVEFASNQGDYDDTDQYFKSIDPNSGIEVVRITKEAFK